MAAKYFVQISAYTGIYQNPFKKGGCGIQWSPWETLLKFQEEDQAKAYYEDTRKRPGLYRFRIQYRNKTLYQTE